MKDAAGMKHTFDHAEPPTGSWCVLPWVHLFADEQGFMRPCCMALEDLDMVNRDENGDPHVIYSSEGIEKAWNSSFMTALRREMLDGQRPPACRRCFRDEDLGMRSHRQMSNEMFHDRIAEALALTAPDGTSSLEHICSVDLRLGNLCNLRCRMCSPVSSKALLREFADFYGLAKDHAKLVHLRQLDWFSRQEVWDIFETYVPQIERLHFAGGEPLLIPQMFDFLERVVAMGRASDMTLSYITNLTVLPPRIFDLWPHFKNVSVTVSLDGFDEINTFIRYPSKWSTLDRNMKTLDAAAERLHCRNSLSFNVTVQVFNIFHLDILLEYVARSFRYFGRPKLSMLYYPEHFSIRILPPEMKEQAAVRLRRFTQRFANHWPARWQGDQLNDLLSTIDGVIDHMMSEDRSELLPAFRQWTQLQDRHRRKSALEVIPELAPLF
jgi:hypothetical protein